MHPIIHKALTATLFATLGAATVFGSQVLARSDSPSAQGPQGRLSDLVEQLDLTDAQKADLVDLRAAMRDRFQDQRSERMEIAQAISDSLDAGTVDRKTLHGLVDRQAEARRKATSETVDDLLDFYETLDETQQALVRARLDTWCQSRSGAGGGRGYRGGQGR